MKQFTPDKKITLFKVFMAPTVMEPLKSVLFSGYIGQGPQVDAFEKKLGEFIHNPYVLALNSGTSALHLALHMAGVRNGDEVISTPMTCTATNWPILAHGAKIVWADIDPTTGNIDPESIKKRITKKTKAIMVVDWGGYPTDIAAIKKIAGNIPVIEDAAHALGSQYKKRMVGESADFTCFSFQAIKHLTSIDGGMLAVKKQSDYKRGILLRWYGIDRNKRSQEDRIEVDVSEWGYKFHMNDVCATIGLENFKHTEEILKKHRNNAAFYTNELQGLNHITLLKEDKQYLSSYWLYTIKVSNRPAFSQYMEERNIMVSQVHRRNDTHPVVEKFRRSLPGVDLFSEHMVCIPVGWWVTHEEREYIVKTIKAFDQSL